MNTEIQRKDIEDSITLLKKKNPEFENEINILQQRYNRPIVTVPCVGCGYCCKKVQCQGSLFKHGKMQTCPELQWNGKRYICKQAKAWEGELDIGGGCCASLFNSYREAMINGEGREITFEEMCEQKPLSWIEEAICERVFCERKEDEELKAFEKEMGFDMVAFSSAVLSVFPSLFILFELTKGIF